MRWFDRSFWLALVCVAAAMGLSVRAQSAGEAPASQTISTLERAGSAEIAGSGLVNGSTAGVPGDSRSARQSRPAADFLAQAGQVVAPLQPELPPEDDDGPPAILAPSSHASLAPSAEPDAPRDDPRLPQKSIDETTRASGQPRSADVPPSVVAAVATRGLDASSGASAADIEAAIESVLAERVEGKPVGARNWRAARIAIGAFYLMRGFAPLWTSEGGLTPGARAAITRIDRAEEDGLDLSALSIPSAARDGLTPAQLAQTDVKLSEAIVAYAIQASGGRIEPTSISPQITDRPNVADPFSALAQVAGASDPDAALENFNPPQKGYRDLRHKLAELRADSAPAATILPPGPTLRIGMVDPRVAAVRARFGLDAIGEGEPPSTLVYDAQAAAAVADFQRANGLSPSGLLTPGTVEALSENTSSRQEAAVIASMEMWRWEPRDMGDERVEVNVPDFTLKVTQGDEIVHRARVIVGKPDTQTAIFSNQIKYLLVNPAWNVPMSIIKKEMLPKLVNDPDYLTRAGFEVTQKGDTLIVRQPPGERNALGHILFMFPNEHSIYLHDTPARGLFAAPRRAFSHGCVRVDDPMRLGELAMGGVERGWTQARLRSLVGDKERTIFLPRPLAIHIEYFTAFVDDAGTLQIREDIYGHARRVEMALGLPTQG
ncbi:MAG: L,D-transpeptidase family protein [Roseiarcus sp.]